MILQVKEFLELKYDFRRNVLTRELEVCSLKDGKFTPMDDAFLNSLWIELQLAGFKAQDSLLTKILNSKLTHEFNPLKDYIENLPPYDGGDYIEELARTIKVADIKTDDVSLRKLWEPYLKKWLVASIASATGRGVNHLCLILVGGQGVGKTTWLNRLCPSLMKDYLVCSHINPTLTDQNTANYLAEKWFVNVDDQLETIFGKDFNSMKAIITAPKVTNRKTWHRFSRTRERICSFMGSVNNPQFLTDSENRRYLVFTTEKIDFKHHIDMEKVWSQALYLLQDGFTYWFTPSELKELNQINEVYRQVPPEEEWLVKLYEPCKPTHPNAKFLMTSEMLSKLTQWSGQRMSTKRLVAAMQKCGFAKKISKRMKGLPRKVYPVIERTDIDEMRWQRDCEVTD